MTAAEIGDKALEKFPYIFRNNRGVFRRGKRFIRCGIPEPRPRKQKNGEFKESDDAMKGGDFIGFTQVEITPDMVGQTVAVFLNLEVKAKGDSLKSGQIKWHNFIIKSGGKSEIWAEKKTGIVINDETI